jgi:hypothetical protein
MADTIDVIDAGDDTVTVATMDSLKALVGEVQASPTANTLLDRLKALLTGVSLAAGANAIGKLAANSGVDIGSVAVTGVAGTVTVAGNVAHDAADSGSPVKVGGYASSTPPAATTAADRCNLWLGLNGQVVIAPISGTAGSDTEQINLSYDAGGNQRGLSAGQYQYSGASNVWNRARNNHEVTALASAARTASTNSSDLTNYNSRGAKIVVDVTAGGGAGGLTVTAKGKDALSGKYYTLIASAVITATGTTVLTVYPGVAEAANVKASDAIPRLWRVEVAAADATTYTYSVGCNYIL